MDLSKITPILLSFEGTKLSLPAKNSSILQPSAYKILSFIPENQAALTTFAFTIVGRIEENFLAQELASPA